MKLCYECFLFKASRRGREFWARRRAGLRGWREECVELLCCVDGGKTLALVLRWRLLRHSIELHPQLDKTSELLSPLFKVIHSKEHTQALIKLITVKLNNPSVFCKSCKMNMYWAQRYKVHKSKAPSQFLFIFLLLTHSLYIYEALVT